jgi:membrane-associated protease RseP (regulator of RpoE activity)
VSPQDYSAAPYPAYAENGNGHGFPHMLSRLHERYWLYGLLFLITLFSTTLVGSSLQADFNRNLPFDVEHYLYAFVNVWSHPGLIWDGLPFSLTLLTILLAHESGHYLACMYYGVDASLPYFLPAPTLMGTFGAFIRIRSAIYSKRVLFDVGVAGPLAGFVFLMPALAVGLAFSKVIPGIALQGDIQFGTPGLLWILQKVIFPGVPAADIYLHPVARAAWIGILATALNLLPIGQLDGGHILYALVGDKHKLLSKIFIAALIPIGYRCWPPYGFRWWPWWLWAVILFFLARRHPMIIDPSSLTPGRKWLALVALIVFMLCFTAAPVLEGAP